MSVRDRLPARPMLTAAVLEQNDVVVMSQLGSRLPSSTEPHSGQSTSMSTSSLYPSSAGSSVSPRTSLTQAGFLQFCP